MTKKKLSKARIEANKRYDAKAYDRLSYTVPKGHRSTIQEAAAKADESVNQYTQNSLLQRMGLSEWPPLNED